MLSGRVEVPVIHQMFRPTYSTASVDFSLIIDIFSNKDSSIYTSKSVIKGLRYCFIVLYTGLSMS